MRKSIRGVLIAATALAAAPAFAAPPAPAKITPELIAAAQKEGQVIWYTSAELGLVESIAKVFEAKYPGITVQLERSGAERNFQRVAQEYSSNIHAVDVIDSSDTSNFLSWKHDGLLAAYVPDGMPAYVPAAYRDPDGFYASWRATLSCMGYNTKLVQPNEAPKSFADLLDPKWDGKLVKAHPGYSGTIMTATYEMARDLGWPYFEKLAKQHVMQVQSANDPAHKLEAGDRAVSVDGVEYLLLLGRARGAPVAPIYPAEGTPFVAGSVGIMKDAPHPNAARLYESFLFSHETQQLITDIGQLRSFDPTVKDPPGRLSLKSIKLMRDDPQGTAAHADEIKQKYSQYFGI
ncbi:MAG TPA: extracellular solute-binding protein [Stellaceae bacterium]|nr:extracellular solute-binding protein [Stellaceae bacterium]